MLAINVKRSPISGAELPPLVAFGFVGVEKEEEERT